MAPEVRPKGRQATRLTRRQSTRNGRRSTALVWLRLGRKAFDGHYDPMSERFVVRPDGRGHSVFDLALGQVAEIASIPQQALSTEDAEHLADLLNQKPSQAAMPA